jgi:hypothetical protein
MRNYHIAIVGGNPVRLRKLTSPPLPPTSHQYKYSWEIEDNELGIHICCYVETHKRYLTASDKQRLGESALRYITRWVLCKA